MYQILIRLLLKWYSLYRHLVKDTLSVILGGEKCQKRESSIQNSSAV